ncbi:MAG: hypothetical protein ABH821_01595 [archaeon]
MNYEMTDERWDAIKAYLDKVWENPEKYPNNALLLSLSEEEVTQLFTKKRLELINVIKAKKPKTVTDLSNLVHRKLSAVLRDLELMEKLNIVELQRKGRTVTPIVQKKVLILPLMKLKPRELKEIKTVA